MWLSLLSGHQLIHYNYTHEFEIETKSQLLILETCLSDRHTYVWVATLLVIYMITLNLAVIGVAFKTSKIRYKHFEDTKATNAFAFLAIFIILTTLLYFFFFTWLEVSVDSFIATDITLYMGNTTFALFCQIFLFAPKVLVVVVFTCMHVYQFFHTVY